MKSFWKIAVICIGLLAAGTLPAQAQFKKLLKKAQEAVETVNNVTTTVTGQTPARRLSRFPREEP